MNNLKKYDGVFISIFNVDVSELNRDFAFRLIKRWDSITHLALVTAIEDEFNIMFDSDDILGFLSYEDGKKIMAKYDIII